MSKNIIVSLNENQIEYEVSPEETLFSLITAINEYCDTNTSLPPLKTLIVDGKTFDLETIDDTADCKLDEVNNVTFITYTTEEYKQYLYDHMPYYIENTLSKIEQISPQLENVASLLSSGKDSEAMEIVADFSDIMEECIQIFAFKDNPTETVNQDFFENTKAILSDLMDAMEKKDSILIGDLMEYEFAPIIGNLKQYLNSIKM